MSLILKPGDTPPDIVPYCQRCDMPCEHISIEMVNGAQQVGINSSCCGQTSSTRIGLSVYLEMRATGAKLYTIVKKGSQAGLRGRKPHLRSLAH